MRIDSLIPKDGPGLTASEVLRRCPDASAELEDIREALKIAEKDGKVYKIGQYYWGTK